MDRVVTRESLDTPKYLLPALVRRKDRTTEMPTRSHNESDATVTRHIVLHEAPSNVAERFATANSATLIAWTAKSAPGPA
jgi:hypothetical protein